MSIPDLCPSCGAKRHIESHAMGCPYSVPEYAHLGWPSYDLDGDRSRDKLYLHQAEEQLKKTESYGILKLLKGMELAQNSDGVIAGAARNGAVLNSMGHPVTNAAAVTLLRSRSEELRKEAQTVSLAEARSKRTFAADILDRIVEELSEDTDGDF